MSGDIFSEFRAAIAAAGIPAPEQIIADGQLHRYGDPKRRGDRDSLWFVLHDGAVPAGAFGSWRHGVSHTWCAKRESDMSKDERAETIRRMKAAQAAREAELKIRQAGAAETARSVWDEAAPATAGHPYLAHKSVQAHGTRVHADGRLVVPLYDAGGELCSVQYIAEDGGKLNLSGGQIAGCHYLIDGDRSTVFVVEGFATGASIAEATGAAVAVAFTAGQLLAVAKLMRERFADAKLIIAADNDVRDDDSPNVGIEKATEAATATGTLLAIPDLGGRKCDFNDVHLELGPDAVREQLGRAELTEQTVFERELAKLMHLSPAMYDRERKAAAGRLGVRPAALDAEIKERRRQRDEARERAAIEGLFPEVEPYDGDVDGRELVDAIRREIRRYVVMDEHSLMAAALWALHTHAVDAAFIAPILLIKSPKKRCGKSTLRDVLAPLVHRGLKVDNISPAALYRAMEMYRPTLLIDEADAFLDEVEGLRGLINAGHMRGSKTLRIGGPNRDQLEAFDPFGPKLIAGIGRRADTIEDRAVIIQLRRRRPDETAEKLRLDRLGNRQLQSQCAAWAAVNMDELRRADPAVPDSLNDRAADNWRPLFAIADVCRIGAEARKAAMALAGSDDSEDIGGMVLADMRRLFADQKTDRVSSAYVVDQLGEIEERPWPEWRHGKPITQRQLARLLEPFGITPTQIKIGGAKTRGYKLEQFADAFSRYLADSAISSGTPVLASNGAAFSATQSGTSEPRVPDRSGTAADPVPDPDPLNASNGAAGTGVPVENCALGAWQEI